MATFSGEEGKKGSRKGQRSGIKGHSTYLQHLLQAWLTIHHGLNNPGELKRKRNSWWVESQGAGPQSSPETMPFSSLPSTVNGSDLALLSAQNPTESWEFSTGHRMSFSHQIPALRWGIRIHTDHKVCLMPASAFILKDLYFTYVIRNQHAP